jgi:hypothetical protein
MTRLRFPDWPQRLDELMVAARERAFAYGDFDCVLFAAGDAVKAITGEDPALLYRGTYHDEAGAAAIIAKAGGLEALVSAHFGVPKHPAYAQRGDLVLAQLALPGQREGECLGVCTGHYSAFASLKGVFLAKRAALRLAWGI